MCLSKRSDAMVIGKVLSADCSARITSAITAASHYVLSCSPRLENDWLEIRSGKLEDCRTGYASGRKRGKGFLVSIDRISSFVVGISGGEMLRARNPSS